jgi:YHS domain-containing protein
MTPHPTGVTRSKAVENKDPVCGMAVTTDSRYRHVHDGRTYLFCSESCLAKFQVLGAPLPHFPGRIVCGLSRTAARHAAEQDAGRLDILAWSV